MKLTKCVKKRRIKNVYEEKKVFVGYLLKLCAHKGKIWRVNEISDSETSIGLFAGMLNCQFISTNLRTVVDVWNPVLRV